MNSEWKRVQISEVCELIVDCVNKTAPKVDGPTPYKMIRTPNIRNGKIDLSDCRYVDRDTYEQWTRRAKIKPGDVLLTREAPMGEVGFVDFDDYVFLGQRIMQYRADTQVLDSRFLYYMLLSDDLQNQFRMHDGSGSVVSHIRVPDCSKFELNLPPLEEQQQIVDILGPIDKKADLLQRTNRTLEQIAQALFKSWFVDFEPVKAKMAALEAGGTAEDVERAAIQAISGKSEAELDSLKTENPEQYDSLARTAALFPSAMVKSELGEIPEGWKLGTVSEVATLETRSIKPSNHPDEVWEHYSIPAYDDGRYPVFHQGKEIKSNKYQVPNSAILVSKLNPRFPRTWWPLLINPELAICSTEFMPFVPIKEEWRSFIAGLVHSEPFQRGMLGRVSGSTGSRQRAQPKEIKSMPIVVPCSDLIETFSERVTPLFEMNSQNTMEAKVLSELRNALLPKLLSGELTVPEMQDDAPEITGA